MQTFHDYAPSSMKNINWALYLTRLIYGPEISGPSTTTTVTSEGASEGEVIFGCHF